MNLSRQRPAFCLSTSVASTHRKSHCDTLRKVPKCQCNQQNYGAQKQTRRRFLQYLPLIPIVADLSFDHPAGVDAAPREKQLEKMVTPVIMCQTIMKPVRRYIEEGAWDKGRTNVNYCTRVLALRKNMKDSAELLDGDSFYEAMDIMGEMSNTMTQLDASLYTPLFIPADEGISVEQKRYQNEARNYYQDAISYLDTFLQKIPQDILTKATAAAAKATYEIKFEAE